jgi:hypothetical protein
MGNAFVRGSQLREAVDAYKSALRVNPSDVDAKYNLEVTQRQLDQSEARRPPPGQQQGQQADGSQSPQQGEAAGSESANAAESGQPQDGRSATGQGSEAAASPGAEGNANVSGYTGTPAGQAEALNPDLKKALEQFDRTGKVDDALRALDIVGQQERIRQTGGGAPPQPQVRDW